MHLLYYWRGDNYRRDLDMGAGYHLNQANPLMHKMEVGDSLWAFTRSSDGRYVLAAELVVRAMTINAPGFRYGAYRVWGDLQESRYFLVEGQPSIEPVIRGLSCEIRAKILGQAFQGLAAVKRITFEDHVALLDAAKNLPLEMRARLLPEERLEATLLLGDESRVEELIREERPGIAEERCRYLLRVAPKRNRELVRELQTMYEGRCQLCLWNPREDYDHEICHGHHIHWLSRGGKDVLENIVIICPNHHAAVHSCDAVFDYSDLAFDFGKHREPLRINLHLENALHN